MKKAKERVPRPCKSIQGCCQRLGNVWNRDGKSTDIKP